MFGVFIAFIAGGLAIELLAGLGLAPRNTPLWAVFHPGWMGYLAILALLLGADTLSRFAQRILRRREGPPMADDHASTSA